MRAGGVIVLLLLAAPAGAVVPAQAERGRILADLEALTGHRPVNGAPIVSRNIRHADHARARDWLLSVLQALPGVAARLEALDASEPGLANVVADLAGADASLPLLLVGAHYDSSASRVPGWDPAADPAPGADDDASGTAAVLEVARMLAAHRGGFRRPLRFVLFDAEEDGLLGSAAHAASVRSSSAAFDLAVNLDPVGYNAGGGNLFWAPWDAGSKEAALSLKAFAASIESELSVQALDEAAFGGDARGDHWPFRQAGLPALHLGAFPQPAQYHTLQDDLPIVDVDYVTAVATLVAGWAAERAEPRPDPDENESEPEGCACGGGAAPAAGLLLAVVRRRRRPGRVRAA